MSAQNLTLTRNGTNRRCIVLQSEHTVGDFEWIKLLMLLNEIVPKIVPGVSAIMEEPTLLRESRAKGLTFKEFHEQRLAAEKANVSPVCTKAKREDRCCDNEDRNFQGGCNNCGAPCL